jgi:hypothetical protein
VCLSSGRNCAARDGVLPACAAAVDSCGAPIAGSDGWTVASLDDRALVDDGALCRLGDRLAALGDPNIHAVVVVRRGRLLFERYFKGADQIPTFIFSPRVQTAMCRPIRGPERDGDDATAATAWRFSLPIRALSDIRFDFERSGTA